MVSKTLKGKQLVSVYQALELMITFGMFILALLTYLDNHNK
ncbi:putative holin-like toxin [Ligilactobacillus agilis]